MEAISLKGVDISLDLAIIVSLVLTIITWAIAKNKNRAEQRAKEQAEIKNLVWEHTQKIRDCVSALAEFKNYYDSIEDQNQQIQL